MHELTIARVDSAYEGGEAHGEDMGSEREFGLCRGDTVTYPRNWRYFTITRILDKHKGFIGLATLTGLPKSSLDKAPCASLGSTVTFCTQMGLVQTTFTQNTTPRYRVYRHWDLCRVHGFGIRSGFPLQVQGSI